MIIRKKEKIKDKTKSKERKKMLLCFGLGVFLTSVIGVSAATLLYSKDVTYDNSSSGLSSTNLQDAIDELYEQVKSAGGCEGLCGTVYAFNTNNVKIGTSTVSDLGTSYATFAEAAASNSNSDGVIALKYTVENNVLTEGYVCFLKDEKVYCLKGYDANAFANNVAILDAAFPTCGASESNASCYDDSVDVLVHSNGRVIEGSYSSSWYCTVEPDGYAHCYNGSGGVGN